MAVASSSEILSAQRLARGICRALSARGYGTLTEFPLNNGRRVDVIGVNSSGETLIVEIKTSVADYRADRKWTEVLRCVLFRRTGRLSPGAAAGGLRADGGGRL